ncbi:MAG: helix-turn-helix transcriptional regulator, partial [Erysipelotrichaceae bacterium]|nr:helix-turn-helix transcriptional regulator [Erysipelotrichaceae bacterium]
MTFGEKLRDARKKAGISQEELAEKLSVSRSAVAKWETDNGLPDVGNLKVLAAVLNVSIDYLLAEDERLTFNEIRKPIDLANYQKAGKCRSKKDAAVYGEYRDADAIWPLIRRKKLNRGEFLLDLLTSWGASQLADYANNPEAYYLVDRGGRQYLVRVGD